MFTGLVEKTGEWRGLQRAGADWELTVAPGTPWEESLVIGESVAVEGACLTVVRDDGETLVCNVLDETLRRTDFDARKAGDLLNLERALRVGDRLGGHLVQGHIDGTGRVLAVGESGGDRIIRIGCDADLLLQMIPKGSIACNGVSLTIAELGTSDFQVNVIPHTWGHTSLVQLFAGKTVNLETDLIGKYVRRSMPGQDAGRISMDILGDAGFS